MNEQTNKLIEQLAVKLGTTTEYLWSVLLVQAKIDAIRNGIFILFTLLCLYLVWKLHLKFSKKNEDGYTIYDDADGMAHLGIILLSVVVVVMVGFSISFIGDIITALVNPEYWALEQIFSIIKGGL